MREYISLFTLILIFFSIAFLSGYKTENSSACSTPPEIIVSDPKESDNIENPPVAVNFDAKQNTTDLVAIDLNKVSVIIKDNIGKVIDITQYISNNCDILKKNCKFSGSVNLSEGEYILQVQVCNTTAACETKEVRFTVYPIKPGGWIDIIKKWANYFRCHYEYLGIGCNSDDDKPDYDCIRNIPGCDNCPDKDNPDQKDTDGDGIGDMCDNCQYKENVDQKDTDGDGVGDVCDNCPDKYNPDQFDSDGDGIGDKCALDDYDGDGLSNDFEKGIGTDPRNADTDGDGLCDSEEIKFETNPNYKDTNMDGKSDYGQIIEGPGCNPKFILQNKLSGACTIPENCIILDDDNDGVKNPLDMFPGEDDNIIREAAPNYWIVNVTVDNINYSRNPITKQVSKKRGSVKGKGLVYADPGNIMGMGDKIYYFPLPVTLGYSTIIYKLEVEGEPYKISNSCTIEMGSFFEDFKNYRIQNLNYYFNINFSGYKITDIGYLTHFIYKGDLSTAECKYGIEDQYPDCGKRYGECNKDVFAYALCNYVSTNCPGLCSFSKSCEGEIGEDKLSPMAAIGAEGIKIPRSYFAKGISFNISGSGLRTLDNNTYFETTYTFNFMPINVSLSKSSLSSLLPSNRSGVSKSDDPSKALYDSNDTDNYAELSIINHFLDILLLAVEVRGKRINDSGGHIGDYHTSTEEDGQRAHWGTFEKDTIDTPKQADKQITWGIESFRSKYYPPEAGGKILIGYTPSFIFSQMKSDGMISEDEEKYFRRNLVGGIIVPVRVDGLVELNADPDNYVLTGDKPAHPLNHYGVPEFVDVIKNLAKKYKELYGKRLRINDISLVNGGIFDINYNWKPPHNEHREGKNVDIGAVTYEGSSVSKEQIEICLDRIGAKNYVSILYEPEPAHFHLTYKK